MDVTFATTPCHFTSIGQLSCHFHPRCRRRSQRRKPPRSRHECHLIPIIFAVCLGGRAWPATGWLKTWFPNDVVVLTDMENEVSLKGS